MTDPSPKTIEAILSWHLCMGVCDAVAEEPSDFFRTKLQAEAPLRPSPIPVDRPAPSKPAAPTNDAIPADEAVQLAQDIAATCASFDALADAISNFEGCPLKKGAKNTVFADGVFGSDVLVIGEAPGRDEDRLGKPFVGRAGQLLDRMLASINCSRSDNALISNVIFWRPPGNRTPTPVEVAICRPFIERLIELTQPKCVVLAGGAPLSALLGVTGIMRSRGKWRDLKTQSGFSAPALPIFHPAFLLRQPAQKKLAWRDLLTLEAKLNES